MKVTVTATTDFVHGKLNLRRGEEQLLPLQIAKDLRDAGHVNFDDGITASADAPQSTDEQQAPDNKMAAQVENMAAPAAEKKGKAKA